MRNLKKFLALVLALMMVVSVMVTVNAASTSTAAEDAAVETLQNYGVLQGFEDGEAHPEKDITRAQMAALVYRIMTGDTTEDEDDVTTKYGSEATKRFTDAGGDWYTGYIGWCANKGILKGYPDKTVKPNTQISGYEVQAMLLRALGYDKNNEYSGDDWTYNILSDATQSGINKDVTKFDPSAKTRRGIVAELTVNAATKADRVAPAVVPNIGYNKLGMKLMEVKGTKTYDDFGAPSTTYTVTHTWPDDPVENTNKVADEPLATFWGPVAQCDVATATGLDDVKLDTYTNGKDNKGTQNIVATNATSLLGAQGRETIVYADRIVYKDTVLAMSTGVTNDINDTGDHPFDDPAVSTTVIVYGNAGMEGLSVPTGLTTAKNGRYTVAGTYAASTMLIGNLLTAANNTIPGGTKLVNAKVVTPAEITIAAIRRAANQKIVGFVGTNGVTYLYDISYSYNTTSDGVEVNGKDTGTVKVLGTDSIGKTYYVYSYTAGDGRNNVLGLASAPAARPQYGVVTGRQPVTVPNPTNDLTHNRAIEYTVLLSDGTTGTFRGLNPDTNAPYDEAELAKADNWMRHLVKIEAAGNGYYKLTAATTDVNGPAATTVYAGDADTLGGVLVDDNTVFFVANYQMANANSNPIAYNTNGYSIYNGFKNLPGDMAYGDKIANIYENGVEVKHYDGNSVRNLDVYAFDATGVNMASKSGTAKYVLILNATEKTPITQRAEKTANYAYVMYDGQAQNIYDAYYLFDVLKDGVAGTLQVNSKTGADVKASGLYIYKPDSTNGYNAFEPTTPVNLITKAAKAWSYSAGVLKLEGDGLGMVNGIAAGSLPAGWNAKYLTVVDNVPIYIVNEKDGGFVKSSYTLSQLKAHYDDIYVQVNEYGWVNLIYVVDKDGGGTGTAKPDTANITYVVNIVDKSGVVGTTVTKTQEDVPAGNSYYETLSSVLTYVGLRPENLLPYGPLPENGTIVAGVNVVVTFNVYYM